MSALAIVTKANASATANNATACQLPLLQLLMLLMLTIILLIISASATAELLHHDYPIITATKTTANIYAKHYKLCCSPKLWLIMSTMLGSLLLHEVMSQQRLLKCILQLQLMLLVLSR